MNASSIYGAVSRDRAREKLLADLVVHDRAIRSTREDLHEAQMRVETIPVVLAALRDMQGSLKAQLAILDAMDVITP